MKKSILSIVLIVITLTLGASAQDFSRLETLSGKLKVQADDLVGRTGRAIKKKGLHSSKEIESVFLAEQLRASTILIQRIIHDRFEPSEIRYAGMMLQDLSGRFPVDGPESFEWKRAKDTVDELSRELRGLTSGNRIEIVGFKENDGTILGKAVWSGMVDADVLIKVKGRKLSSITMAGRAYPDGTYTFSNKLPAQNRIRVGVKLKHGRGKVHVIEQPGADNDYTATIQVRDEAGGARPYSLEIFWYRR